MIAVPIFILLFLLGAVAVLLISSVALFVIRRSMGSGSAPPRVLDDGSDSVSFSSSPPLIAVPEDNPLPPVFQDDSQPMPNAPDLQAAAEPHVRSVEAPALLEDPDPPSMPDLAPVLLENPDPPFAPPSFSDPPSAPDLAPPPLPDPVQDASSNVA